MNSKPMQKTKQTACVCSLLLLTGLLLAILAACQSTPERSEGAPWRPYDPQPTSAVHAPLSGLERVVLAQYAVEWHNASAKNSYPVEARHAAKATNDGARDLIEKLQARVFNSVIGFSVSPTLPGAAPARNCLGEVFCPDGEPEWLRFDNTPHGGKLCAIANESVQSLADAHQADGVLAACVYWRYHMSRQGLASRREHVDPSRPLEVFVTYRLYGKDGELLANGVTHGEKRPGPAADSRKAAEVFTHATERAQDALVQNLLAAKKADTANESNP